MLRRGNSRVDAVLGLLWQVQAGGDGGREQRKQRGVLTGNMLEHSLGGGLPFGDGAPQ